MDTARLNGGFVDARHVHSCTNRSRARERCLFQNWPLPGGQGSLTGPLSALLPCLMLDLKPAVGRRANSFHLACNSGQSPRPPCTGGTARWHRCRIGYRVWSGRACLVVDRTTKAGSEPNNTIFRKQSANSATNVLGSGLMSTVLVQ